MPTHERPSLFLINWHTHLRDLHETEQPKDFFYVSNSEWNLYDFLRDFFALNDLPKGVFFLQTLKKGLRDIVYFREGQSQPQAKQHRFSDEILSQQTLYFGRRQWAKKTWRFMRIWRQDTVTESKGF
jgi:hypothetical protein